MNGNTISETYKPSGSAVSTPSKPHGLPSTPTRSAYGGDASGHQRTTPRPITKKGGNNWAYEQEYKIKVLDLPKNCWTGEVHKAMSRYGNVVRVEIQLGADNNNNAWVLFQ